MMPGIELRIAKRLTNKQTGIFQQQQKLAVQK
jgi:hypothetical protein